MISVSFSRRNIQSKKNLFCLNLNLVLDSFCIERRSPRQHEQLINDDVHQADMVEIKNKSLLQS